MRPTNYISLFLLLTFGLAYNSLLAQLDTTKQVSPISLTDTITNDISHHIGDSIYITPDSLNSSTDTSTAIVMPDLSSLEEEKVEIIDSLLIYYFKETIENEKANNIYDLDTSLTRAHQFDPLKVNNGMYSTLSNIGLAYKNMVFSPRTITGYDMTVTSFNKYIYNNPSVKYYKVYIPHSMISYVMGSKKEQNLQVLLNREIIKNLSIGFDFALNNSPGPYKYSSSNNTRVFFTGQYYTANKRYGVIANYRNNRIRVEENGGIVNDSLFENNIESDRRVIDVNLQTASQKLFTSGFFVEQYFNLSKSNSKNDSVKRKIDVGHIAYSFNYRRNQLIYQDEEPLADYYLAYAPPLDSTSTYDSIYQSRISNKLMWSSLGYNENKLSKVFYIYFGATYDIISQTLAYDSVATKYNQFSPFGGISLNLFKSMYLKAYAELVMSEFSGGDYKIQADINQYLGTLERNVGRVDAGVLLLNSKPLWWYENFQSNRFRWQNDFKKETSLLFHGKYTFRNIGAGFKFNTFSNYTYLNDSVKPAQYEKAATHLQLFIEGTVPIKKFGIDTRLVYQGTSIPSIMRLPQFSGLMNIYFKSEIFKKAATVQTGFQLNYYTSYFADAYMPALRAFYIQNEKEIGDYIFVDFYLTLKVKRANLFFKAANLTSYLGNYTYYNAPHYPGRDARFYFGASWRFHN